jgi:hypothetical protein
MRPAFALSIGRMPEAELRGLERLALTIPADGAGA